MSLYPLASTTWDDSEIKAIQDVLATGMYTMGPLVQQFEERFANDVGSRYAVMVNSGSSANLLAVAALFFCSENPLKPGDEVIVPAVSWATTYYPLHQYGLKLKFVDIDLNTLNYDLSALADAITDQTRLVMCVNLLGNPNDFAAIKKLLQGKNVRLLEDNCESLGAVFEGKQAGTYGVMGTFSTFFSHHMSTMEGGLIVTDDEEFYHLLLSLRSHGWTRHLPKHNKVTGIKSDDPFEESFKFVLPGYNVRPSEINAAIGIEQLKKLPMMIEKRRQNAAYFQQQLGEHSDFLIQQEIGESSWFGFSLVIRPDSSLKRGEVVQRLSDNNIECRPIVAGNFTKNEVIKWFDYEIHGALPNAERIDAFGLFVGNHHFDIKAQIDTLRDVLSPTVIHR